jgi:hypothetical protein
MITGTEQRQHWVLVHGWVMDGGPGANLLGGYQLGRGLRV